MKYEYPEFYSGSLNAAISSGVFKANNDNDRETLKIICTYSISLIKLQNMLDLTDQVLFVGVGRKPLEEWRRVRRSHELDLFKKVHNRVGELLKRDGWLAQEGFFKVSDRTEALRELHDKVGIILKQDPNTAPESLVLSKDDWKILCQWNTKVSDMLRPDGYFEIKGLLRGDTRQKILFYHDILGQVLERTSTSTEGSRVLTGKQYNEIVRLYSNITFLIKCDRWITKELDMLQLNI